MTYKYKAVGRIVKRGKRIGFVVQYLDSQGKRHTQKLNDTAIKKMMNDGETFNLTYDSRGFKLRGSNKRVSDLPITHIGNKKEAGYP